MVSDFEKLKEWAINYVKNQDIIHNKLKNIKNNSKGFLAEYEDKTTQFIIKPHIKEIKDLKEKDFISIVLFNTKQNLDFVVNKWNELIKYEKLSIYFVNLNNNERWVLHPFTHNKVCSNKKLKNGLITLFDNIEGYKGSTDKTQSA